MQAAQQYEYMVKTEGASSWDSIEDFGETLEGMLNEEGRAYAELGWELWHIQILSDADLGNNGIVYVFRRPRT